VSDGERRYFLVVSVIATLSLTTIGGTFALERYVGPADEILPFLTTSLRTAPDAPHPAPPPAAASEPEPELNGEARVPCVAALVAQNHESHFLPPLELDERELGCQPMFD